MKTHDRYNLRSFIDELKSENVEHAELLSIYSPPGQDVGHLLRELCDKKAEASSIRSDVARKNVTEALEQAIKRISLYDRTPEKGFVAILSKSLLLKTYH